LVRGSFLWDFSAVNNPIRLRWKLWLTGLSLIGEHGLLGIGLSNFQFGFFHYLSPDVRPTKFLHNTYLQIPLELGLLGALALAVALWILLKSILSRRYERAREDTSVHYALMASMLVFVIANAFEIVLYFHSVGLLGAFIIGLWLRRRTDKEIVPNQKIVFRPAGIIAAVLCLVAALMLGRWWLADHFYGKAIDQITYDIAGTPADDQSVLDREGSVESGTANPRYLDQLRLASKYVKTAIIFDGSNYRYHHLFGYLLEENRKSGGTVRPVEIISAYRQAVQLCPLQPNLHYSLGLSYLREGELLKGSQEISLAAYLHPTDEHYQAARESVNQQIIKMTTRKMQTDVEENEQ
jgi:hypothetical protein